jgi:hypothetical protein
MGEAETNDSVQSEPSAGEDYEALYDSIMQPDVETSAPTEGSETESAKPPSDPPVKSEEPTTGEFILKHPSFGEKGERGFERDKVVEYAQKGFDYESKMSELKTSKKEYEDSLKAFEAERETFTKDREYWSDIDQYMKENPRFEQIVKEQWAKEQGSTYEPPNPQVQALQEQVKSLLGRLDAKDTEQKEIQTKQATTKLEQTVANYKETNKELDWEGKDEFGKTLQERVEEFAVENEIKSFTNAANLMLFDQLQKIAVTRAKEETGKSIQKQKKLGLGPITEKPTQTGEVASAHSYREKSYEDLAGEALAELGLG